MSEESKYIPSPEELAVIRKMWGKYRDARNITPTQEALAVIDKIVASEPEPVGALKWYLRCTSSRAKFLVDTAGRVPVPSRALDPSETDNADRIRRHRAKKIAAGEPPRRAQFTPSPVEAPSMPPRTLDGLPAQQTALSYAKVLATAQVYGWTAEAAEFLNVDRNILNDLHRVLRVNGLAR